MRIRASTGRAAEDRQVAVEVLGEDPQVVQAEQMVGVFVRVEHGVDQSDPFAEQLAAQLGRGVDEEVSAGQAQGHAASGPLVLRIGAGAGGAAAADLRHAVRRARAEKDQLAGEIVVEQGVVKHAAGPWLMRPPPLLLPTR